MKRSTLFLTITTALTLGLLAPRLTRLGEAAPKCVNIYYDRAPGEQPNYTFGRTHAMYLQNLLGHFPKIQQRVKPIERYEAGEVERCHTSFYLGTHYNAHIPAAFLADYVSTKRQVVWAGYQIWRLEPKTLESLWGVRFNGLSKLDSRLIDKNGRPEFFKYYDYKGQTFIKYGDFDRNVPERFNAAHEITLWELSGEDADKNVVSWARHSRLNQDSPYILRKANHWYIGDSPFSFITEEDRYLIFADLLFDMLEEKPRWEGAKKPALFRLEDVHARVAIWQLYSMARLLEKHHVPFSMTIIPVFADPIMGAKEKPENRFRLITQSPAFLEWLEFAKARRASFIFHGVTHQSGNRINPFTGTTGDDFEFWDRVTNKPMPPEWDNPRFVTERLEWGLELLKRARVDPIAWLPPHYQASPQDYVIFSQLMRWTVGRVIYFPFTQINRPTPVPDSLLFENDRLVKDGDSLRLALKGQRLPYFERLKVSYPEELSPSGQFYPYEIYGDYYGQRIVPENVGNVQPYLNEQVHKTLNVDDLIRILKRNRVLRDVWGSYFVHPFQLDDTTSEGSGRFPNDTAEIERLIIETKKAGYDFIDLGEWLKQASIEKRPETIELIE